MGGTKGSGGTVRRRRRGWVLVAALVAVALVGAACGDDDGDGGSGAGDASEADPNGVMRWGLNLPNFLFQDKWDPANSNNACEFVMFSYIYGTLLETDSAGKLGPGLAESWKITDPSTLELKLRTGQKFHNGDPLNAAAVKASLEYFKARQEVLKTQFDLANVTSVTAVDDLTVRMTLSKPEASSLQYSLSKRPGMPIHSSTIAGQGTSKPIGAGPFMFESYSPNQRVVLKKYADYREPSELGGIEFIQTDIGPPQITALQSGAIDLTVASSPTDLVPIRNNPDYGIDSTNTLTYQNIHFALRTPYMQNLKFRQALNHAIKKEDIRQVVSEGDGDITWQVFPKGHPGYVEALDKYYPYDQAKAKQLLQESGFPSVTVNLVYPGSAGNVSQLKAIEVIQQQLQAVGLKVNPLPAPDTPAIMRLFFEPGAASDGFSAATPGSFDPASQLLDKWGVGSFQAVRTNRESQALTDTVRKYQQNPNDIAALQAGTRLVVEQAMDVPFFFTPRLVEWDKNTVGGEPDAPSDVCDNVKLDGVYMKK